MGTSISHPSLRSTNWKPVLAGYTSEKIPESRIINEIWRASDKEGISISEYLKTDSVYSCYKAIDSSKNFQEALQKCNSIIKETKGNTMVTEFAKRMIPVSFQSANPAREWQSNFLSEVTNYFVSRDLSGFVGTNYRNKSINDLIKFKKRMGDKVKEIVASEKQRIGSKDDWNTYVDRCVNKLKVAGNE